MSTPRDTLLTTLRSTLMKERTIAQTLNRSITVPPPRGLHVLLYGALVHHNGKPTSAVWLQRELKVAEMAVTRRLYEVPLAFTDKLYGKHEKTDLTDLTDALVRDLATIELQGGPRMDLEVERLVAWIRLYSAMLDSLALWVHVVQRVPAAKACEGIMDLGTHRIVSAYLAYQYTSPFHRTLREYTLALLTLSLWQSLTDPKGTFMTAVELTQRSLVQGTYGIAMESLYTLKRREGGLDELNAHLRSCLRTAPKESSSSRRTVQRH